VEDDEIGPGIFVGKRRKDAGTQDCIADRGWYDYPYPSGISRQGLTTVRGCKQLQCDHADCPIQEAHHAVRSRQGP
jgi:hypothetical protein